MITETAPGQVCTECRAALVNGDTSGMTDAERATWEAGVAATAGLWEGWTPAGDLCDVVDLSGDCPCGPEEHTYDGHFSATDCNYCGTRLGGQRFQFAFIRETTGA